MQYRRIPNTSSKISEIGFGCGGNAGLMVRGSFKEQERVVARALDVGIDYFDNAPDYGNGAAETNLGRVLASLHARAFVTSKVEIRRDDLGNIAGHVVRSCEESLRRLQRERIDCFMLHNGPTHADPRLEGGSYRRLALGDYLGARGALEGLEKLKAAGKIAFAGFVCRAGDAAAIRKVLATDRFQFINVPYTSINPSAAYPHFQTAPQQHYGGVMLDARRHCAGCAIFSPLAGGYLTDGFLDGDAGHPLARAHDASSPESTRALDVAKRLRFLAAENGITLAQAAYRFILAQPSVTTVIGGFSSLQQLEEIAAVSGMPPFSAQDMARVEAVWREAAQT
jgi:aryl-alcohol dehydrogenase-like predicted oxidoreductase